MKNFFESRILSSHASEKSSDSFYSLIFGLVVFAWILVGFFSLLSYFLSKESLFLKLALVILVWFGSLFVLNLLKVSFEFLYPLLFLSFFPFLSLFLWIGTKVFFLVFALFPVLSVFFLLRGSREGVIWALAFDLYFLFFLLFVVSSIDLRFIFLFASVNYMGILSLFYQRKQEFQNKKVWELQYVDKLTACWNREKLMEDLADGHDWTLFLINIDRFREINDVFGPKIGDQVLLMLSKELQNLFPHIENRFYKLAGDEFAFLFDLSGMARHENIVNGIAKLIAQKVSRSKIEVEGHPIHIRVSIGVANSRLSNKGHLLADADIALKKAKLDRLDYVYFKETLQTRSNYEKNLKWLNLLLEALESNRIVSFYQPIYDLEKGQVLKYECLVRMISPKGDVIAPFFFLDIAAKARLQSDLTREMFRQAFETFYHRSEEFSINLSVSEVIDPVSRSMIFAILDRYPESVRSRLVIELLETDEIRDYQSINYFIAELKKRGCKVAIDDFGSGFANFEYLAKLSVDYLKIDGSLIKNIAKDTTVYLTCETIAGFGKRLRLKTIAEFVENEDIYWKVKELGIDAAQGYFIGKPEPQLLPPNFRLNLL